MVDPEQVAREAIATIEGAADDVAQDDVDDLDDYLRTKAETLQERLEEIENPLDRGDTSGYEHSCDGCGSPTNKTPIPLREAMSVDLALCETCRKALAHRLADKTVIGGEQ